MQYSRTTKGESKDYLKKEIGELREKETKWVNELAKLEVTKNDNSTNMEKYNNALAKLNHSKNQLRVKHETLKMLEHADTKMGMEIGDVERSCAEPHSGVERSCAEPHSGVEQSGIDE